MITHETIDLALSWANDETRDGDALEVVPELMGKMDVDDAVAHYPFSPMDEVVAMAKCGQAACDLMDDMRDPALLKEFFSLIQATQLHAFMLGVICGAGKVD